MCCSFAQVFQLAMLIDPACGPLKHAPTISHSTRPSVMAVIRRRVNGPPIFERPSHIWLTSGFVFLRTAGMCVSLIAIAVCRIDRITLDRFIDLVSMHRHVTRGSNAKANFVAPDLDDHHADVVTYHDFLIYGAR